MHASAIVVISRVLSRLFIAVRPNLTAQTTALPSRRAETAVAHADSGKVFFYRFDGYEPRSPIVKSAHRLVDRSRVSLSRIFEQHYLKSVVYKIDGCMTDNSDGACGKTLTTEFAYRIDVSR